MTKEELKLDAESRLDEWSDPNMGCCEGYCYSEVADFMFRFSEPREERIETLEKENAELKERADKADLDSVLFFNQLCKAKAIIKDYMIVADHITVCSVPEENRCINVLKLNEQAEQFLKEVDE